MTHEQGSKVTGNITNVTLPVIYRKITSNSPVIYQ